MDWLDIKEFFKDTFKYIIVILTVLIIAIYVVSLQQVVGPSMSNTFNNGDIVILDKLTPRFKELERGDIISFYYADSKYLIKRVIGIPGDHIEFQNNKLYINGVFYSEAYIDGVVTNDFKLEDLGYDVIPEDMYFVLGDNRVNSKDSRDKEVGLVSKKDIIGKVRLRLWPISEFKILR